MALTKIYLRYYPPGIALCYQFANGVQKLSHIDLLDLNRKSDTTSIVSSILAKERITVDTKKTKCETDDIVADLNKDNEIRVALQQAIDKLQRKLCEPTDKMFYLHHTQMHHMLPLTNVCFDRSGERCLTGSYDRTCRVTNTTNNRTELVLEHENVVFSVGFNFPKCDRIVTASFDTCASVWNATTGKRESSLRGHTAEVVGAEFDPLHSTSVATASMDGTARLFDVETSTELQVLTHHAAEVIANRFNREGNLLLTGSFDRTAALWDIRSKSLVAQLRGHSAELSTAVWNFLPCDLIATASLDSSVRIWDARRLDQSLYTLTDHRDEVLDVAFDCTGQYLATGSSDNTARVWSIKGELKSISLISDHTDEVSKVCFSPSGCMLLTASADHTARLWIVEDGTCLQVLAGHKAEVFSCAFSYLGDIIVTASKDNTCRLWR